MKITTLIENNKNEENSLLINEHGLSLFIKYNGVNILFDTGQSGEFINNAIKLDIDLKEIDYVIVSHNHYDHGGGIKSLNDYLKKPFKLLVGKGFFKDKYKLLDNGNYIPHGKTFDERFIIDNHIMLSYVNKDIMEISKDLYLFSNFQRYNTVEELSNKFYILKDNKYIKDEFKEEIVLGINTEKGLILIVGCAHIGIVNILESISKRTNKKIYGVIGGCHLVNGSKERIQFTVDYFKTKNIKLLGLCHCTGEDGMKVISKEFKEEFIYNYTGNTIDLRNI
ncbi:MAG: MBL fold metallo-hydrolase [Clostridiales bacterium]|nr:MBL fold metallo-hydrolase [Clostridiales bacterium]